MKYLLLLVLLLSSCGSPQEEPAPVIRPQAGKSLCPTVCAHWIKLGCAEAAPVHAPKEVLACDASSCAPLIECEADAGVKECVPCTWFCEYQHDNGVYWNTACLVDATCAEIETTCNVQ